MTADFVPFADLIAALCFVLALRFKNSVWAVAGSVIAILTALMQPDVFSYTAIVVGIVIGGAVATVIVKRSRAERLAQLIPVLYGVSGLAAFLTATGILISTGVPTEALAAVGVFMCLLFGVASALLAGRAFFSEQENRHPWLGACVGLAVAGLGFTMSSLILIVAGGLVCSACARMALKSE
ncbi:MAG: NAD(P)(+) transhydrogenase (Re/Si-specific) subunit beta [Alphaproteobacteria bacterium]|nr:NAD(P)(+) transhydrogenase (Re/Si-specific) subunit beta [Alphaproteobacteria bacterium]